MKKILAGVLAAASLLSMTVSASAATNDKAVTTAGEVEYDVAVTAPKVVLNLVMPAKMEAQLNPYGAQIKLDNTLDIKNGIAGLAYKIDNKTKDYGIYIDATATTTVTRAVKTETWTVNEVAANTKSAELALVGGNTVDEIKKVADDAIAATSPVAIATKAAAADADATKPPVQGALLMDSTVPADTTNRIPAGQTKQKKMMFIGAEKQGYMAFVGNLGAGEDDEWLEDDAINVALVLKVVAGPKTFSGTATTTNTAAAKLPANAVTLTGFTGVTWDPDTESYTSTAAFDQSSGNYAIQIDPSKLTATQKVTLSATSDDTGLASGTTRTITSSSTAGNTCKTTMNFASADGNGNYVEFTVKIEDTSDSSETTYTVLVGTKS